MSAPSVTKIVVDEIITGEVPQEIAEEKKTKKIFFDSIGGYFKGVTALPQFTMSFIHFIDTGGFPKFYEHSFSLHVCVLGVLGEGAALMYEIYRAYAYEARWTQIANYSLTTFLYYYYGVHKQYHIFIWKQNWCFLFIPILCLMRIKLLRRKAVGRALAMLMSFVLILIISFRLYTIGRIVNLVQDKEIPMLLVVSFEAIVEIYWLYCFMRSIYRSCQDKEVMAVLFRRKFEGETEESVTN